MQALIDQIRAELPIAQFVAPYTNGLKPTGRGVWFIGRCPFHQRPDDPPNKRKFWVNTEKGVCGCFVPRCPAFCDKRNDPGSMPMDVINFYARLRGVSNQQAVKELAAWIDKSFSGGNRAKL